MHTYIDYITELQSLIQDSAQKLTTSIPGGDVDRALQKALRDHSKNVPMYVKMKIQGNGTATYPISTTLGTLWIPGLSIIKSIEYPIAQIPKTVLESGQFEIYDNGTAFDASSLFIRLMTYSPSVSEYFVVEFNTELLMDYTGIMNFQDTNKTFSNLTTLAAVSCCQRLSAAYAQSTDGTITADVVNYNDKSAKYSALAKQYQKQYNLSVFGKEEPELSVQSAYREINIVPTNDQDGGRSLFH